MKKKKEVVMRRSYNPMDQQPPKIHIPKEVKDKFDTVFGGPRIPQEQKELRYNKNVLVGQWFEESRKFLRHNFPRETIYQTEYKNPNVSQEAVATNQNIMHDGKIRGLGEQQGPADLDYSTNFSTLYDLTYNRAAPALLSNEMRHYSSMTRSYMPERDFTYNHVGGVNKGLLAYKQDEWERDRNPEEGMYTTTTRQDFIPHLPLGHKIFKQPLINPDAVALDRFKVETQEYPTRAEAVCFCVEHPKVCWVEPRNPKNILPSL